MTTIINGSSPSITFTDSTTQATATFSSQVAKAWCNFNFNGTSIVIVSSYNVSSVTRSSAGLYLITFTTAMANTSYVPICSGSGTNSSIAVPTAQTFIGQGYQTNSIATTGFTMVDLYSTASAYDTTANCFVIFSS